VAPAYPPLTILVVVVTANHFWLDGIVAAALLAAVRPAQKILGRPHDGLPESGPTSAKVDVRSSR
jgi:hypothetical protein